MSRADRILIVCLAVVAALAIPVTVRGAENGPSIVVVEGPKGRTTLPLSENTTVDAEGSTGTVTVLVQGGAVCVRDAECPDHVCVDTGWIESRGRVIACVPNGVTVRVESRGMEGLDAVVR